MNWKGCGRKRLWANTRRCFDSLLQGLDRIGESIRSAGLGAEIWTRELPHMKQVVYVESRTELLSFNAESKRSWRCFDTDVSGLGRRLTRHFPVQWFDNLLGAGSEPHGRITVWVQVLTGFQLPEQTHIRIGIHAASSFSLLFIVTCNKQYRRIPALHRYCVIFTPRIIKQIQLYFLKKEMQRAVFLLSCPRARQFCRTGGLHSPGHAMRAAALRRKIDTLDGRVVMPPKTPN